MNKSIGTFRKRVCTSDVKKHFLKYVKETWRRQWVTEKNIEYTKDSTWFDPNLRWPSRMSSCTVMVGPKTIQWCKGASLMRVQGMEWRQRRN